MKEFTINVTYKIGKHPEEKGVFRLKANSKEDAETKAKHLAVVHGYNNLVIHSVKG